MSRRRGGAKVVTPLKPKSFSFSLLKWGSVSSFLARLYCPHPEVGREGGQAVVALQLEGERGRGRRLTATPSLCPFPKHTASSPSPSLNIPRLGESMKAGEDSSKRSYSLRSELK